MNVWRPWLQPDESSENSLTKSEKDQAKGFDPRPWVKAVRYREPKT